MQNTDRKQNSSLAATDTALLGRQRNRRTLLRAMLLLAACALMALVAVTGTPSKAYAKSYTMPKVDITANAATDASLNVVENRTFDFDGSFSAVWWTFSGLPSNASLKVNSVGVTRVDSQGNAQGPTEQLTSVPFVLSWRDDGGPATDAYSVDTPKNTVYVFFKASNERAVVSLDYTIVNGVQAYKDVGDIYWKYVADQWQVDSQNVTMNLTLPVPSGTEVVPGDNVRAWGHGPSDGKVSIGTDGKVTYTVPRVPAGQYAEARVVFPTSWLTNLSGAASLVHINELHLDDVLNQEQAWADAANRDRLLSLAFVIGCAVVSALVLVWAIVMFVRNGKEHKPDFTDQYWRDVPSPIDHPAVIARLWRWDKESNNDFTATLMHLAHIGAIQINKGSYEKPTRFGSKQEDDYYITRVPAVAGTLTKAIDLNAMDLLFNDIAKGQDSLWFGSIQVYGKENPEAFVNAMKSWQGEVSAAVNKRNFFEMKGKKLQMTMVLIAVILLVVGVGIGVFGENFIPLIFFAPVAVALFFIANFMPRRSREGNNIQAKSEALRNWLKDFSALDERPPTDVKVWGEFMVYAFIFGIAKQVIAALQVRVPELFAEDEGVMGTAYVPWWFWYGTARGPSGAVMPSVSEMFQASVSNTVSTAQSAISAASGNFSGGGGGGGGFSGGGGGGFGGGGGAR